MVNCPLDPELVVPDVKSNFPLTPRVPASTLNTRTEPLDFVMPKPVCKETEPPVVSAVCPERTITEPPSAVVSAL